MPDPVESKRSLRASPSPGATLPGVGRGFRATIESVQGQPSLVVNGTPRFLHVPFLHKAPYESFAAARAGVYMISDPPIPIRPDGLVDTAEIEREADAVLAREKDALLVLRTCLSAPAWWLDAHPDEVMRFDRDATQYFGADYRDASWASDLWLDLLKSCYEQTCARLHARYEGRVILYQFGMGSCGENHPIGACASDGRWFCADFSPAMTRHFRRWLRARYGTDEALRAAWSRPEAMLETAEAPPREERLRTDWFTFRDPRRAWSADYYQCFAERIEEIVIALCGTIKQATRRESLAGSHLGALMDTGYHAYMYHQACTNMVHRALAHPDVDTFTSPASYENRAPGGDSTSMMPVGSYLLHDKLIYQDQDTRTFHVSDAVRRTFTLGRIAGDARETSGVLKRDVGQAVIRGYGYWWHAMVKDMYNHPAVGDCIARLAEVGRRSLRFPRGVASGAAFIVDEESVFHQQCANRLFYPMLYDQRQHQWGRSGIAWNLFLHNDLAHPRFPDHKLYYFLNTFYMTDAELEAVEKRVKRNGAVVVWTYAPGIQSPEGIDLARASRLTGFRLRAADVEALPRVSFTAMDHPFIRHRQPKGGDRYIHGGLPPGYIGAGAMGNDDRAGIFGPVIYVDDPDAETLGELDALQAPGFCVKRFDDWTSVFVSAPMLNAFVLRNMAREAGIHVYAEQGDVVLPGRSFLTVHAREAGEKHVRLPSPADVYECYDGRLIGRQVSEFRDTLERHATGLYFLGSVDDYLQEGDRTGREGVL